MKILGNLFASEGGGHIGSCYITPNITGYKIEKSFGTVFYVMENIKDLPKGVGQIFDKLLTMAHTRGGNAVIKAHVQAMTVKDKYTLLAFGEAVEAYKL